MNKYLTSFLAAAVAVTALTGSAFAAKLPTVTVKGTLLDMKCYSALGVTSRKHGMGCGKTCLSEGLPAGILVHGKAWTLATNSRKLADYVGLKIKVTGQADAKDSIVIPTSIKVWVHGMWKKVG